jgi:hypothetical protein
VRRSAAACATAPDASIPFSGEAAGTAAVPAASLSRQGTGKPRSPGGPPVGRIETSGLNSFLFERVCGLRFPGYLAGSPAE